MTAEQVERLLGAVDVSKATGPDDVSPRLLKHCARELSAPLTTVFASCLREVRVVHKKTQVVGKLLEQIVSAVICQHMSENHLLSDRQFGFGPGRSTADLLLILSKDWQNILEEGLDTLVVALDIAGAFDRVWHAGLVEKLRAKSVQAVICGSISQRLHTLPLLLLPRQSTCRH
ncbi:uncharacterized protein LOC135105389 [Scylla paramamosain]|uniref:uncharacterized protein LOC135105389 n=1 Tax=Scylla paramamosain TaxID=85552 RepID=UPI00308398C0